MIKGSSLFRAFVGLTSSITPTRSSKIKLYINLRGVSPIGGPDRFLRSFSPVLQERNITISNWTLKGCVAALVFSASWGNSFTWLCRRLGIRSVLRVDGFYVPELYGPGKKYLLTNYQKWVNQRLAMDLENFDYVIYQSAFSKEQADLHLYHRANAYSIIHNGVDTQFFKPQVQEKQDECPTIVVLGKHRSEHLSLALDVFKCVRSVQEAKLLIVGPMRDDKGCVSDFVADYLKDKILEKDIHTLGTVLYDKLPGVLSQADVFLHVKVGDWCPNAVIEAMACGLPIVCPAWGGTKELIGSAGIAVEGPPWSINDALRDGMAKAVLEIWEQIEVYSAQAINMARKCYDIRLIAEKYLEVMKVDFGVKDE